MLKGWNRKVRITSAIKSAWMMTQIVSPKPLSDFVPDVTLIAFPIPVAIARGGRHVLAANLEVVSRRKMTFGRMCEPNSADPIQPVRGGGRFRPLFAGAQSRPP